MIGFFSLSVESRPVPLQQEMTNRCMLMRQLFLSFLMAGSLLLSFASTAKAQDIRDDGEEVIVIDITNQNTETEPQRSIVPICATYYSNHSIVEVEFLNNLGNVTIKLTNLFSGDVTLFQVPSGICDVIVPVYLGMGVYCLEFIVGNSQSYIGYFIS